jgi:hypothetical protein
LDQIQLLRGHPSFQTTERYLGTKDLVHAPNVGIKLRVGVYLEVPGAYQKKRPSSIRGLQSFRRATAPACASWNNLAKRSKASSSTCAPGSRNRDHGAAIHRGYEVPPFGSRVTLSAGCAT